MYIHLEMSEYKSINTYIYTYIYICVRQQLFVLFPLVEHFNIYHYFKHFATKHFLINTTSL